MGARTKARKRALDVLFEADQKGENVLETLEARLALPGTQAPLPQYSEQIVRGVVEQWVTLNGLIQEASPEWTLARMPAVDRAILRISAWEIVYNDDVPVAVAIDEALTLAGDLSTDDSPKFINGVLGSIAGQASSEA